MGKPGIFCLTETEKKVLYLRDSKNLTFKEIGVELGDKSLSRARQIYNHAKSIQKAYEKVVGEVNAASEEVSFYNMVYLNLSPRYYNALARAKKLNDKDTFMSMTDDEIKSIRGLGVNGYNQVKKLMRFINNEPEEVFPFRDEDIDPEMLEIVKNFNRAGVETEFCCQGHFKDSEQGMSIPYLSTRFPKSDKVFLALIKGQVKYPMLNILIDFAMPYTPNLEEYCEPDEYIKRLDDALKHCEGGHIDIRVNSIFYNLAEEIYSDETYHEKVFEHLRRKFISDLLKLSEDILKIYRSNK